MRFAHHLPLILMSAILVLAPALGSRADTPEDLSKGAGDRPHRALVLSDEQEVGAARWDMIQGENKELSAVFFLHDARKVGMAALAGYCEAAQRGAKVRLVIDGNGPARWMEARISPGMLQALEECGVAIRLYNQVDMSKITNQLKFSSYQHTHDKLMIFGGQKIISTGDRNMQNINFRMQKTNGRSGKTYHSIETLVEGPVTEDAQAYFNQLWESSLTLPPKIDPPPTATQVAQAKRNIQRYIQFMNGSGHVRQNWNARMIPVENVSFYSDVPAFKGKVPGSEVPLLEMIENAKKSITIMSPYMVLTPKFKVALHAAMARGVQLTIVGAAPHAADPAIAPRAFEKQGRQLAAEGASIYKHDGPYMMHAKVLIIDDELASVTSHNLDGVSEFLNLESGVIVKSKAYAADLNKFVQEMIGQSKPFGPSKMTPAEACMASFFRLLTTTVMPRM